MSSTKSDGQIWFSEIRDWTTTKNKFHREVVDCLIKYDCLLTETPEGLAEQIVNDVTTIHKSHPRCHPLGIEFTRLGGTGEYWIEVGNLMKFKLIKIKGRFSRVGVQPFLTFSKTDS